MFEELFKRAKRKSTPNSVSRYAWVWSPKKGDYKIYWDEPVIKDEPIELPHYVHNLERSPYSKFKDEKKNEMMDRYWKELCKWGIPEIMKSEGIYRSAQIQLVTSYYDYPLMYRKGMKGYLLHESFLDLLPEVVQKKYRKGLDKDFFLCSFHKLPIMFHKKNFIILEEEIEKNLFNR